MDHGRQEQKGGRPRAYTGPRHPAQQQQQQQSQQPQQWGYGRQQTQPGPAGGHPAQRTYQQPQRMQHGPAPMGGFTVPPSIRQRPAAGAAPAGAAGAGTTQAERLVADSADTSQPVASRVASLQQLNQALYSPATQSEGLQRLSSIWPRLVALLWDPQHAVCAAAAAPVGALGALAGQAAAAQQAQRGIASGAGGMLFDWLLPVLTSQTSPKGERLSPNQLMAILLALRNCLAGVDALTLSRYANAVFEACQGLLEEESTAPQLVPPLLEVVMQASKHQHALRGRFTDLVDLLLGWALEPSLPPAARLGLARAFLSFQPQWQQQPAFAASLLGDLLNDMERFSGAATLTPAGASAGAGAASSAQEGAEVDVGKVLGLAPCVLAILEASWQEGSEQQGRAAGIILRLARCLAAAVQCISKQRPSPLGPPPADSAPTLAELASHVSRLADLAAKLGPAAARAAPPPAQHAQQPVKVLQRAQQQQQAATGVTAGGGMGPSVAGAGEVAAAVEGPSQDWVSIQLTVCSQADAGRLEEGMPQHPQQQHSNGDQKAGEPSADSDAASAKQALSLFSPAPSHHGSERVLLHLSIHKELTQHGAGAIDDVARDVQLAFSTVLSFVEDSLQIPSLGARPDAVVALLAVLRRWLGVGGVLEGRGAWGELSLMWTSVEAQLLHGSGSSISKLRLCCDAAVLRCTAELYLQLLRQSPTALPLLMGEIELLAAQFGPSAGSMALPDPRPAPPDAAAAAATAEGRRARQHSSTRAATLLLFDFELLSVLLLAPGSRHAGRSQGTTDSQQKAHGGAAGQGAMLLRLADTLPVVWGLLYRLVGPSGPLLHHQALWIRAFELLFALTAVRLSPQHHSPSSTARSEAACPLPPPAIGAAAEEALRTDVALLMLHLSAALLFCSLERSRAGHVGPAVAALGEAVTEAGGWAEDEPLLNPPPSPGCLVPTLAVLAVLQRFCEAAVQLLGGTPSADSRGVREMRHAVHAVVGLAARATSASVRGTALAVLMELLVPDSSPLSGLVPACSSSSSQHASSGSGREPGGGAGPAVLAAVRFRCSRVLLEDPVLVADITQVAVASLGDLAPAVAQQAQQLLLGAGASLATATASACAGASHASIHSSRGGGEMRLPAELALPHSAPAASEVHEARRVAFALALQPQHLVFKPAQLTRLVNYLTQGAPATVLVGGGRASSQLQDWLPRLLYSLPAMPTHATKGPRSYEGDILSVEDFTTLSQAAVFAVHEAARQFVAARLKTHLGGPTHTFAALDQALQRLAEDGNKGQPTTSQLQPAWLFLEFLHALEQGIFNSHTGSVGRPSPSTGALAFFTGNKKVCQDWFARMCPLALRAAAAAQHHPLTLRLGLNRLRSLEAQASQLVASIPPSTPAVVTFFPGAGGLGRSAAGQPGSSGSGRGEGGSWASKLLLRGASNKPGSGALDPGAGSTEGLGADQRDRGTTSPAAGVGGGPIQPSSSTPQSSPAAALLAAAQGSPVAGHGSLMAGRGLLPAAPRHMQQAQQLWQKAADAAAVTARALCALRDPDGVAELRQYCNTAFGPLCQILRQVGPGSQMGGALPRQLLAVGAVSSSPAALAARQELGAVNGVQQPSGGDSTGVAAGASVQGSTAPAKQLPQHSGVTAPASSAVWGWLEAVQLHAAGQYEAALQRYASQQGSMPGPVRQLIEVLRAEAFAAIQDWQGMQAWVQESPDVARLPSAVPSHYLALSSWATGNATSAAQQLQLAPAAASRGSSAGLLHGSLASSLVAEGATLRAVLQHAQQQPSSQVPHGKGRSSTAGGSRQKLSDAGAQPPGTTAGQAAVQDAMGAVLQQALLLDSMGGALGHPGLLARPLVCLAALAPLAPAVACAQGAPPPAAQACVLASPFEAEVLRFAPWGCPLTPSMGQAGQDILLRHDAAPISGLLSMDARAQQGVGGGGIASMAPMPAATRVGLLMAAAHTAGASGNSKLAAALLAQAESALVQPPPAATPAPSPVGQESTHLQLALARLCLAFQLGEGGTMAPQAQQAWQLLLDCSRAAAVSHMPASSTGGADQAGSTVSCTTAAAALLLLHWSIPCQPGRTGAASAAGGAAASPAEGAVPGLGLDGSPSAQEHLVEQAKALVAETMLPWEASPGDPSSLRSRCTADDSRDCAVRVDGWETNLADGATIAAQHGSMGSGGEVQAGSLLQYAALKAALAAVPGCAQLWWSFAEWATEHAEQAQQQGNGGELGARAVQQSRSAAFNAYCKAVSLGFVNGSSEEEVLPALLQIVRLLSADASHIPPAPLQAALDAVPGASWLAVVPQLMAVLARSCSSTASSGEAVQEANAQVVKKAVLSVLLRAGRHAPAEVVLPALVELKEPHLGNQELLAALQELVHACEKHHPLLVGQLCALSDGLSRAAVLWEEQWHMLLQEAAAVASRGLGALQAELASLSEDQQLEALREGYLSAMAPSILLIHSGVQACSEWGPETPHEACMLSTLGPMLRSLCDQLVQPPTSNADLPQRTQAIKQAAGRVAQHLQDRHLQLSEVAPSLSALRHTVIAVPGASAQEVTVEAFLPTLHMLHTKTRPKRVTLLGSDGRQYMYLLKGKEDLRTDERLGQFMRASGAALRSGGTLGLDVHSFGVTPVARRTGLVQWVDNTVPLYEVYTSWHSRQTDRAALLAAARKQAQGASSESTAPAPRKPMKPVEAFFSTLVPALKAAGVDPSSPRDQWPLPVLQHVFRTLAATAPRSMLADELWCGAGGVADWWERQQAYTQSTSAVSMVGYLLGLGDRHMDNILIHKQYGHVVHLDFNVIFGRGLDLKVPEVVPFRLTQSLVEALGPAGAHGRFQLGCERALRLLRSHAKPLAALLEASVADPLVDWNAEEKEKARRRAFELAAALQLYALVHNNAGFAMRTMAAAATTALAACAAALGDYVQLFQQAAAAASLAADNRELFQRCQATLVESEGLEQAAVAKLAEGQQAMGLMLTQAAPVAEVAMRALHECQAWQERHIAVVSVLLADPPEAMAVASACWDPSAAAVPLCLVGPTPHGAPCLLQQALGMAPSDAPLPQELLQQATGLDELGQELLNQRAQSISVLMDALQQYAAALAFLLGPQYATTSRHAQWGEAFGAALALPVPQGFQRAAELAPHKQDTSALLSAWQSLVATSAATSALLQRLSSTQSGLQLERVDLALFANEAKERLLGLLGPADQHSAGSMAGIMRALASFSQRQADAVGGLHKGALEGPAASAILDSLQPLVLGYTTTAVAFQQAGNVLFEDLFTAPDGSNRLDWLSGIVQTVDGLASLALELQLLCPAVLGLATSQHAQQVTADLAALQGIQPDSAAGFVGEEAQVLEAVHVLERLAVQFPPMGSVLQLLQQVHAVALQLGESAGAAEQPAGAAGDSAAGATGQLQQQLWLVQAACRLWNAVLAAIAGTEADSAAAAPEGDADGAARAADGGGGRLARWEHCSEAVAAMVDREVVRWVLPAVAVSFEAAAANFREAAAAQQLGDRSAGGSALQSQHPVAVDVQRAQQRADGAQQSRHAQLVPFTDFDDSLVPAGELLGELEPAGMELEPFTPAPGGSLAGESGGLLGEPLEGAAGHVSGMGAQYETGTGPALVPFTDFDDSLAEEDGLLEPLEGADYELGEEEEHAFSSGRDWEGLSQLSEAEFATQNAELQRVQMTSGAGVDEERLAAALGGCAGATGALAAVDSLLYLTGLAVQQCLQQAKQAAFEVARLEWLNEDGLMQVGLQPNQLGSWAGASGIGVHMVEDARMVHPLLAGWSLRLPRLQLLQSMQHALQELAQLQPQLQQLQAGVAQLGKQLEDQLSPVMLFAMPALQGYFVAQQQWLIASAGHAATLAQLSQAVLQFEASRIDPAAGQVNSPQQAQDGWQQYQAVLQQMQLLHQAYLAAEGTIGAANTELAGVQQRKSEALSVMQTSQARASEAEVQLSSTALPLIKATLALGRGMKSLSPSLAGLADQANLLQQAQRQLSTLCSVLRRAQHAEREQAPPRSQLHKHCLEAVRQLQSAAACMASLPEAVRAVQQGLQAAQSRVLQKKGRGEVAARETAAQLVALLQPAILQLQPQMEALCSTQKLLSALPSMVGSLAQQAQQQAAQLAQQHNLTPLQGLPSLLGISVPMELQPTAASQDAADVVGCAPLPPAPGQPWQRIRPSMAQTVGLPALAGAAPAQGAAASSAREWKTEGRSYAASVVGRFWSKLRDYQEGSPSDRTVAAGAGAQRAVGEAEAGGPAGGGVEVGAEELVRKLIGAATGETNLVRMYEGWMAWV